MGGLDDVTLRGLGQLANGRQLILDPLLGANLSLGTSTSALDTMSPPPRLELWFTVPGFTVPSDLDEELDSLLE